MKEYRDNGHKSNGDRVDDDLSYNNKIKYYRLFNYRRALPRVSDVLDNSQFFTESSARGLVRKIERCHELYDLMQDLPQQQHHRKSGYSRNHHNSYSHNSYSHNYRGQTSSNMGYGGRYGSSTQRSRSYHNQTSSRSSSQPHRDYKPRYRQTNFSSDNSGLRPHNSELRAYQKEYEELAESAISSYKSHVPSKTAAVSSHMMTDAVGAEVITAEGLHQTLLLLPQHQLQLQQPPYKQKLIDRVNSSLYSQTDKTALLDKVDNVQTDSSSDKYMQWFNIVLSIPKTPVVLADKFSSLEVLLNNVMVHLNSNIYGMPAVKEEIACTLASMFIRPNNKGKSLGLCGPAGVGKTAILRSIADGVGLPFYQINVGNLADSLSLDGHGFTYTKSEPGLIVRALRAMGYNNGILCFDEVDKLSESDKATDIIASLLHITDFTQNSNYQDNYVGELAVDLSGLFFVFTMNDTSRVNKTLLSRIPVINLPGYSDKEKAHILNYYLLPNALGNYNMTEISLDSDAVSYMLSLVNDHKGVRELKELLEMLCKRLALYYHSTDIKQLQDLSFRLDIDKFTRPFITTREFALTLLKSVTSKRSDSVCCHLLYS